MNFLAPSAFFLGLLLPVIVAFYLLKRRRTEQPISSVYLWQRMVRDVEANAPWQRLRFNWLMILQLLTLLALIFALARPFSWTEGSSGQAAIFIVDTSASMAATDVAPNRLESARQRARQLIADLPDSARVTIINAGMEAQVKVSSSLDRRQANQALAEMQITPTAADLTTALQIASAIAARQPGTDIFVLSDGREKLPTHLVVKGRLRYIPFGLSGDNQSVSLVSLQPAADGTQTAFVQVSNYSQTYVTRRLLLYADGQLINSFDLKDIPTGGQRGVSMEGLPASVHQVEARLDGADALPLDDHALTVQQQAQKITIRLVGGNNVFLNTALSLMPGIDLIAEEPPSLPATALTPLPAGTPTTQPTPTAALTNDSTPALTIYDATLPDTLPKQGSLLLIAPPGSTSLFNLNSVTLVKAPTPRALDASDPLLNHVVLSNISVLDAVDISLPDWATSVIGGDLPDGRSVPLLFRGEVNGQRVAVLAFDLHHSDLPLNVAFPLLWSNLTDWLMPGARQGLPAQVAPGGALTFAAPAVSPTEKRASSATIVRPDGSSIQVQAENGQFLFNDTTQLGLYQVRYTGGAVADFAVNLLSAQESDLLPADSLAGVESQEAGATSGQLGQREWWRILALLALGLLMGEWLVYQRAALARFRDFLRVRLPQRMSGLRKGLK